MTKKYTNKLKNHKYSPGIATYGLRGPAGKDGLHGNGFFICAYNLSNTESETRTIAINKLNNNEYLSDTVNEKIARKYLANDLIIDITGSIYSVVEVQNEQGMIERLSFSEEPIGNIELINEAGLNARIFNTGVFKRIVNNADIEGLDIVTDTELLKSDEYNDINSRKYPIRIFNSDKDIINDGNKALNPFATFNVLNNNEHVYLNIYHNSDEDVIEFDSNKAIKFNTEFLELDVVNDIPDESIPIGYTNVKVNEDNSKRILEIIYNFISMTKENKLVFDKAEFIKLIEEKNKVNTAVSSTIKSANPLFIVSTKGNGNLLDQQAVSSERKIWTIETFATEIEKLVTDINKIDNIVFVKIIDKIEFTISYE